MVRGEEKQFEITIDRLSEYAKNIKVSLELLLRRMEVEGDNMSWPQVLDSFTTICGQMNTLMRYTRENRSQFIENRVVLPLLLSPDRDEDLAKLTEGRVQLVNHEMVPDYLRTKPDPEIEEFEKNLQIKASTISPDNAVKQINAMNKLVDNAVNTIRASSVRSDNEMTRQISKPTYHNNDTNDLVMAISTGKGLRMGHTRMTNQMIVNNETMIGQKQHEHMTTQTISKSNVKAPELKTNIKTGP